MYDLCHEINAAVFIFFISILIIQGSTNVLYDKQNLICEGPNDLYWISIKFIYIILAQLFSVFLAFQTRKVVIKALNDSKYVAIIIYVSTVIVTMMIIFTFTLDKFLNADGAVFGGLIYIFTTIILTILFIPKVGSFSECIGSIILAT